MPDTSAVVLPPGETLLLTLRLAGFNPARAGRERQQRRVAAQAAARGKPPGPPPRM